MLQFPKPSGLAVVLFLSVVFLAACGKPETAEAPIRSVKVLTVGQSDTSMEFEFSGEVRARVETALGFRVNGKLLQRPADIGQRVKAGQLLAELDPMDYRLAAVASTAQLASAQTNRDLAAADLKRYQGLFDQGFISSAELERRDSIFKAAQAQWQQAQAQNSVQGNQSSYTRLLADAAGVVTSVDANVGQVVSAGQPVVRLAIDGPRDVWFSVPEDKLKYFVDRRRPASALVERRLGAQRQSARCLRQRRPRHPHVFSQSRFGRRCQSGFRRHGECQLAARQISHFENCQTAQQCFAI